MDKHIEQLPGQQNKVVSLNTDPNDITERTDDDNFNESFQNDDIVGGPEHQNLGGGTGYAAGNNHGITDGSQN